MSAASNYTEDRTLDFWLKANSQSTTAPTTVYCALFTSDDSTGLTAENLEAGILTNEVATDSANDSAYQRQAITFGTISNGSVSNSDALTFPVATADYGTVTHVAVMDSATEGSGNVLFYGALQTAREILQDDTFQIVAGSLTVSLA